jgi:hypothetical protein
MVMITGEEYSFLLSSADDEQHHSVDWVNCHQPTMARRIKSGMKGSEVV